MFSFYNKLFKVRPVEPDFIGSLACVKKEKLPLQDNEVRISVKAASLNFRDIMVATGLLAEKAVYCGLFGDSLGLDCAGIISEVGQRVTMLRVGDEVLAIGKDTLTGSLITKEAYCVKKPADMSFPEAAALPVVYLTAHYAINYLAKLRKHEKILIHAGAGGVGLAAIHLARKIGAEIFATVGSEKKENYLHALGVDKRHVFCSRSLAFKDHVMEATQGKGVDVVINSLTKKGMQTGVNCLAPFGRFIELGKKDIYDNNCLPLKPFRNNISYFALDVDQLVKHKPDLTQTLLAEIVDIYRTYTLKSHPITCFSMENLSKGFYTMLRARHIGKIVFEIEQKDTSQANIMQHNEQGKKSPYVLREELLLMNSDKRAGVLKERMLDVLCLILGISDRKGIDTHVPLTSMGLNFLTLHQLMRWIELNFQTSFSVEQIKKKSTLEDIINYLLHLKKS